MGDGDAPAVIVIAKFDGGTVEQVAGVERGANFVEGNPSPGEIDIGDAALLADTGDGDEFSSRDGDGEGWLGGRFRGNQGADRVYASGSQKNVPAGLRGKAWRTRDCAGGNQAAALQYQIFGGDIVFVGEDSGLEDELLGGFECVGRGDQVGG